MRPLTCLVVSLPALACVFATGCTADSSSANDEMDETASALGSAIDVPNPGGAYSAKITANGNGCPAGTWDAAISRDGTTVTLTFQRFSAVVNPGETFSIKECTLGIDLRG